MSEATSVSNLCKSVVAAHKVHDYRRFYGLSSSKILDVAERQGENGAAEMRENIPVRGEGTPDGRGGD